MGYIGVSLIVASVVWVIVAPPPWIHPFMPHFLLAWRNITPPRSLPPPPSDRKSSAQADPAPESSKSEKPNAPPTLNLPPEEPARASAPSDCVAMPPPPPPPTIQAPSSVPPPVIAEPDEQITPKANPANPSAPVPSFSLEGPSQPSSLGATPSVAAASRGSMPPPPLRTNNNMPPPPAPSRGPAPPRLAAFPAMDSPQRARPVPNRAPPAATSSLAPPPTHSAKAPKPSRKVILTPGHSPLDWARISGPNADLRNLPANTPYLKVTPSMLKKMTGRKGKDAWMALGGRVYNITPYLPYHPAGEPELLRGAARDGTKLFGEIHPWVNYETMLSACLVGLLVDEDEGTQPSAMDEMD
ncbi:Cytochrome b5 reductase 4 [Colletotrichum chlorophyti]|uniref:Cytochrome b5 reductase 4 n=1 Tax=Colletotrichum chlorophyti TaxID=708187 RepID=A0A1Q8RZ03_9PEZI|nr:Cytochrome b5 reductase 4 [Colletotrichum chlorophyti]